MGNPYSPYIAIVIACAVLNLMLGIYSRVRKSDFAGTRFYSLSAFAAAVYAGGYGFELASGSLKEIKFWIVVEYIGMPVVPPLCLALALHYVGLERHIRGARLPLMFVIPAVSLLLNATNDYHHLFYRSLELRPGAPWPIAQIQVGEWYLVHGAYTFGCLFAAALLLAGQWSKTKREYHGQLATLIAWMVVPIVAAFVYLMGLTPDGIDPVPILSSVSTALSAWAVLTNRLLTVVPVARDTIFESMRDGVLVLNAFDRLADYNQAAAAMMPMLGKSAIGRPIDEIWRDRHGVPFPIRPHADDTEQAEQLVEWPGQDGVSYYRLRSSPVSRPGSAGAGRIVVLIDVTEQRRLQEHLQRLAYYDGLTGIYNRSHLLRLGKERLAESLAADLPFSLILFDIDRFKRINDTHGHETGDAAIRHVVGICRDALAPDMLFGRYGGEEFVLCLPALGLAEAAAVAEALRGAIERIPLTTPQGDLRITASFGVSSASAATDSVRKLLREADEALYRSKSGGRNAVARAAR